MSSRPTALQSILVMAASGVTSAMLYSDWFHGCCMEGARWTLIIVTLPADLIALLLADGNAHAAREWHFYVGLAVQFYLLFWLIRWIAQRRRPS
jgi:phosphoglycerol transferase MdoB-like AlkP superfamily enzyme